METSIYKVKSPEKVGEELKTHRDGLGLSLAQLAARVGCNSATIHHWEKGREGGACQVSRVALALGLTPNQLLIEAGPVEDHAAQLARPELQADIRRAVLALVMMDRLCAGSTTNPVAVFADHVEGLNRSFMGGKSITPAGSGAAAHPSVPAISQQLLLEPEELDQVLWWLMEESSKVSGERPLHTAFQKIATRLADDNAPALPQEPLDESDAAKDAAETDAPSAKAPSRPVARRKKKGPGSSS